jgi:3-oxoacyl-[acyl-carrier-protein] synthase II
VAIGSGIGNLEDILAVNEQFQAHGYRKVTPYFIPKILINLAAGHISILHGFQVSIEIDQP